MQQLKQGTMKKIVNTDYLNEFSFLDNLELEDAAPAPAIIKPYRGVVIKETFISDSEAPAKTIKAKKVPTKKVKRISREGQQTTADYINFDTAMRVGEKLLLEDKRKLIGLYIIFSINTGLRVSDVLGMTWEHLLQPKKQGDKTYILVKEGKTDKIRRINYNTAILKAIELIQFQPSDLKRNVFTSQKGSVYTIQQLNRILKDVFSKEAKEHNISTHSLRKTFGRRVYDNNNESEKALVMLSEMFQHSSISITRKYLGIRMEELEDIYLNL